MVKKGSTVELWRANGSRHISKSLMMEGFARDIVSRIAREATTSLYPTGYVGERHSNQQLMATARELLRAGNEQGNLETNLFEDIPIEHYQINPNVNGESVHEYGTNPTPPDSPPAMSTPENNNLALRLAQVDQHRAFLAIPTESPHQDSRLNSSVTPLQIEDARLLGSADRATLIAYIEKRHKVSKRYPTVSELLSHASNVLRTGPYHALERSLLS